MDLPTSTGFLSYKIFKKKFFLQEILNQLIHSDLNVSPENCCQLFNNLYSSNFVEAYKILNQYAAEIVQIYKILAYAPRAVSMFLNATEKIVAQSSNVKVYFMSFEIFRES
jgi:hypothetical protein